MIISIKSTDRSNKLSVPINDEKTDSKLPRSAAKLVNINLGCS
jgi:hypothetical protein